MDSKQHKVILVLADISGYTRFMLDSRTSLTHGQVAITQLMEAVIQEVDVPLEISKLEGDAIFLYAVQKGDAAQWEQTRRCISEKLIAFFQAFYHALDELVATNFCSCSGCKNLEKLNLKVLVHSGEALFYRIGRFEELSGVDVIVLHRLLKNSVAAKRYLLLSDAATVELRLPPELKATRNVEHYDDVGDIGTSVCYPMPDRGDPLGSAASSPSGVPRAPLSRRITVGIAKAWRLLPVMLGLARLPSFRNLPGKQTPQSSGAPLEG